MLHINYRLGAAKGAFAFLHDIQVWAAVERRRMNLDCETLSILYSGSIRTISILEAERVYRGNA